MLALAPMVLSGCVGAHLHEMKTLQEDMQHQEELAESAKHVNEPTKREGVVVHGLLPISARPYRIHIKVPDKWLDEPAGFHSLIPVQPIKFVNYLAKRGVHVEITSEARKRMVIGMLQSSGTGPSSPGAAGQGKGQGYMLDVDGTLRDLFDIVATQTHTYWKPIGDHKVRFYVYDTRRYTLPVMPKKISVTGNASSDAAGGTAGGAGAGASPTAAAASGGGEQLDLWQSIKKALESLKSSGGQVTLIKSAGLIIVRDEPPVLRRMDAVIEKIENTVSSQVIFDIAVLVWTDTHDVQDLCSVNALFQNPRFKAALKGAGAVIAGAGTGSLAIIRPTSPCNGSDAVLRALTDTGMISLAYRGSPVTHNLMPVDVSITRKVQYISQVQAGAVGQGGVTTGPSVQPSSVTEGIYLHLFPRVLPNLDVQISMSFNVSSIDKLVRLGDNGSVTMELPVRSQFSLSDNIRLHDGDVAILPVSNLSRKGASRVPLPSFLGITSSPRAAQCGMIVISPKVYDMGPFVL